MLRLMVRSVLVALVLGMGWKAGDAGIRKFWRSCSAPTCSRPSCSVPMYVATPVPTWSGCCGGCYAPSCASSCYGPACAGPYGSSMPGPMGYGSLDTVYGPPAMGGALIGPGSYYPGSNSPQVTGLPMPSYYAPVPAEYAPILPAPATDLVW